MKTECGELREQVGGGGLRRGPWTPEEDDLLTRCVACQGEGRWNLLARSAGLKRTGKSCRLRWLNYLKPDIKRGDLTPQEQLLILELHSKWGNRWSKIAAQLPGRTDNEIKNYWRTRVQKQARQLNMESNSQSFIDAIRCFYKPRLLQKIEQNLTNSTNLNSEGSPSPSPTQNAHLMYYPTMLGSDSNRPTSCSNITPPNPGICGATQHPTTTTASFANGQTINISKGSYLAVEDCYNVDNSNYSDMDLGSMGAANNPFSDCQVVGHKWMWDDMAVDGIWGWDDHLWQFRK